MNIVKIMVAVSLVAGCGAVEVVNHEGVANAPFDGPGWDAHAGRPRDGSPRRVVVAGTHLKLRNKLQAHEAFWKVMTPVHEALKTQAGLIGYATRVSADLNEDWTMSVWENEEAMYNYVAGDPHSNAITRMEPFATGGWVTHFDVDISELPLRMDDVIARIKAEGIKAYPNVPDQPE